MEMMMAPVAAAAAAAAASIGQQQQGLKKVLVFPPYNNNYKSCCSCSFPLLSLRTSHIRYANNTNPPPIQQQQQHQELENELEDDDEDYLYDDAYEEEEENEVLYVGDGAGGGGISLAGTPWDKEALAMAENVLLSFDDRDLKIYAFKTLANSTIRVRIEKLSNNSGSPSMTDIEAFSSAYRSRLDEAAEIAGSIIPKDVSLEVSSPGVERVVRVPEELERFKERAMYVKYACEDAATEGEGIFRLISVDRESDSCVWGLADVKKNREKAGKGRPLNKKQREWRVNTTFQSLRLVRIHSDI